MAPIAKSRRELEPEPWRLSNAGRPIAQPLEPRGTPHRRRGFAALRLRLPQRASSPASPCPSRHSYDASCSFAWAPVPQDRGAAAGRGRIPRSACPRRAVVDLSRTTTRGFVGLAAAVALTRAVRARRRVVLVGARAVGIEAPRGVRRNRVFI
jgi:hypothetical protein